jgi:hypothetical protein
MSHYKSAAVFDNGCRFWQGLSPLKAAAAALAATGAVGAAS